MDGVPLVQGMILAAVLFLLGLAGVLARRNLIFILASVEIMLNAAGLAFIVAGAHWGRIDGQVMFVFILSVAAAEVSIGLAFGLRFRRRFGTLDVDAARRLKDG